ncbi:DOG2 [Nakaseomyces glabratus]|uniref:2-deoxyglucose-6-phosphate phosphatase 2 n=1 Tax=Candida glabrata (strain ATCC 2001 / BCRC 20586 / JCM 3761 / NBRC 0622 / NRRL Y-65 / CBS 138) TaxID=284593 RepID=Q6FW00_CANGA|nr:uncharacterized protein CAGL0D04092g [Nakaseomyces glabratus]KAH7608041.1 Haloacid dehalogenase-like hydrolase [Nakaseomyces glabratus]KAH7608447.1 Haloacid dehalogenase-like hydrolase [Nakaseomyces glabratus]QHS65228.1 DOG2 [Nakaseomyces glabratus]CAG58505.1 unnamed protein product [Nakaseomyces glabratus]|eukprot:XP_445594.1 uncharacterized protein CAGL0D04092g [[Candida] glabrata]
MTVKKDNQFSVDVCLFDLDGTIVSTTVAAESAWRMLCAKEGVDPEELFKFSHGVRTSEVLAKFFPNIDNTDNKMTRELELSMANNFLDTVSLIPGAKDLLLTLDKDTARQGAKFNERKWAIVTSGSPDLAFSWFKTILKEVGKPDVFITAFDVTKGKPDPEGYAKAKKLLCERLQYESASATSVVFEDAPAGIKAGKAMGAITVGITSTYDLQTLIDAGADYVVKDLTQVEVLKNTEGDQITLEIENPLNQ